MKFKRRVFGFFRFLVYLGICVSTSVQAQISTAGRILGTGGAGYAFNGEVGALLSNPAGIASLPHFGALLAHRYDHHQPDVSSQALLLSSPIYHMHLGVSYVQYSLPDAYYDRAISAFLGRSFGPYLRVALGMRSSQLKIPAHVNHRRLQLLLGLQYNLTGDFTLGLVLDNMLLTSSSHSISQQTHQDARAQPRIGAGTQYKMGDQVILRLDIALFPFSSHGGVEYQLVPDAFTLRAGLSSVGWLPTAGFGISKSWWRLDLNSEFHPHLGLSPQFDLNIIW